LIVESYQEWGYPEKVKYEVPDSVKPQEACYYDLIRLPHGHVPAPKAHFWSWLSVPVKTVRDYNTFTCPTCGEGTFFKTWSDCGNCRYDFNDLSASHYDERREKLRGILKNLEYALLPLLILLGEAWYMPSTRPKGYREELKAKRIYDPPLESIAKSETAKNTLDNYLNEAVR